MLTPYGKQNTAKSIDTLYRFAIKHTKMRYVEQHADAAEHLTGFLPAQE